MIFRWDKLFLGISPANLFRYFPFVGPKTLADLQDSLHSVETRLSEADIFFLERGGERDKYELIKTV